MKTFLLVVIGFLVSVFVSIWSFLKGIAKFKIVKRWYILPTIVPVTVVKGKKKKRKTYCHLLLMWFRWGLLFRKFRVK